MKIQLIDFGGRSPERAHANDAGADVFSPDDIVISPGEISKIPLGFGLRIPDGFAGYIFPRSGLSTKGIVCELPPIDSSYTGEVHAIISNVGRRAYEIKTGDNGKLIWECPHCGNRNQDKMSVARRTCGYIGTQFWNQGRTQEIKERVLHL